MMKYLFSFAILFAFSLHAQTLGALKNRLNLETDRQKIETCLDISELNNIPRDTSIFYLNKALKISKKIKFDSIYPIQFALSISNYFKGDIQKAKIEIKKGYNSYKFTKDPTATYGHIDMLLGAFSEAVNQIDSATYYYQKALKKLEPCSTSKCTEILSSTYANMANVYLKKGQYKKAIEVYLKAVKLSEKVNDKSNLEVVYSNIANSYKEINDYNTAKQYFEKALHTAKELKDNRVIVSVYIGLGEISNLQKNKKQAINYFLKAEEILQNTEILDLSNNVYQNLAQTYLEMGNIAKATYYSNKAINGINNTKDQYTKVFILLTKANIQQLHSNIEAAINTTNKALDLAEKNNYLNLKKKALEQKIQLLRIQKNYKEATNTFDEYLVVKDSVLNSDKIKSITEIETKYQTEKKEKENLQLKAEKAKKQLELEKVNKQKWLFATALGAAILSLAIFAFFYRKNKEQKEIIENLQKDLHHRVKNNLAIIDSLIEDIKDEFDNNSFQEKLTDLQNRIDSINQVHKQLYQTDDITNLKLKKYVEKLAKNVQESFGENNITIKNNIDENLNLEVEKSFPLGLIINEFLTNSFKHAFTKNQKGEITIEINLKDKNYKLTLKDNGKGLDDNMDLKNSNSFGMTIMQLLAKQLNGTFNLKNNNGVELQIEFPTT